MTFSLVEVLVLFMTIALGIGVAAFLRLAMRMGRAADEMTQATRQIAEVIPGIKVFVGDAEAVTRDLRAVTKTTSAIADNVHAITGAASDVTERLARGFDGQMGAAIAGARAGLEALRHGRSDNGPQRSGSEMEEEVERVSH